jgi:hypothetical protein
MFNFGILFLGFSLNETKPEVYSSLQYTYYFLTDGDQDGGGRIVSPPLQLLVREGTDVILPCHTLNQGKVSPSLQLLVRE